MDVTTATRFHPGEHVGSALLRLGLIPLLGVNIAELLVYDTLVVGVTMLHHADVSLGGWDRPLSWLIVTPNLHKVHHSHVRSETDSNYATVLSVWDRLGGSRRVRLYPKAIVFGLDEFQGERWQTVSGMLRTPFVARERTSRLS
jgi:sterol desaturase/sphingolipid hydroxylase (fatty acid hydroxylase superfamily)